MDPLTRLSVAWEEPRTLVLGYGAVYGEPNRTVTTSGSAATRGEGWLLQEIGPWNWKDVQVLHRNVRQQYVAARVANAFDQTVAVRIYGSERLAADGQPVARLLRPGDLEWVHRTDTSDSPTMVIEARTLPGELVFCTIRSRPGVWATGLHKDSTPPSVQVVGHQIGCPR
jgi:hypothetical protein